MSKKPKKFEMYGTYLEQAKYTWYACLADIISISFEGYGSKRSRRMKLMTIKSHKASKVK
jgi:hypothetical protein